jgi:hypothetical protein
MHTSACCKGGDYQTWAQSISVTGELIVITLKFSGLDHNQDEDHYHLLLKIHEMRGLTLRSRFETYLATHGKDYAASSFVETQGEGLSQGEDTFHIGISQRHGNLEEDQTFETEESSVPDEFRPNRMRSTDGTVRGAHYSKDVVAANEAAVEAKARPVQNAAHSVRNRSAIPQAYTPSPRDRRALVDIPPAKAQILHSLRPHSPIVQKISGLPQPPFPLVTEEEGLAPWLIRDGQRPDDDGDDELGLSDMEPSVNHYRGKKSRANLNGISRTVDHRPGNMRDILAEDRRLYTRSPVAGGHTSDGLPATPRSFSLLDEPLPRGTSRFPAMSLATPTILTTPLATSTPLPPKTLDGFSSMDESMTIAGEETDRGSRTSVPYTYGGAVRRKIATRGHLQPVDHKINLPRSTSPQLPSRDQADIHQLRVLEKEAYEMDRRFEQSGGDLKGLMDEALAYWKAGVYGRVLEKWMNQYKFEKVTRDL